MVSATRRSGRPVQVRRVATTRPYSAACSAAEPPIAPRPRACVRGRGPVAQALAPGRGDRGRQPGLHRTAQAEQRGQGVLRFPGRRRPAAQHRGHCGPAALHRGSPAGPPGPAREPRLVEPDRHRIGRAAAGQDQDAQVIGVRGPRRPARPGRRKRWPASALRICSLSRSGWPGARSSPAAQRSSCLRPSQDTRATAGGTPRHHGALTGLHPSPAAPGSRPARSSWWA